MFSQKGKHYPDRLPKIWVKGKRLFCNSFKYRKYFDNSFKYQNLLQFCFQNKLLKNELSFSELQSPPTAVTRKKRRPRLPPSERIQRKIEKENENTSNGESAFLRSSRHFGLLLQILKVQVFTLDDSNDQILTRNYFNSNC